MLDYQDSLVLPKLYYLLITCWIRIHYMGNITHGARIRLKGRDYGWFVLNPWADVPLSLIHQTVGALKAVTSTQHRAWYQGHPQLNWI